MHTGMYETCVTKTLRVCVWERPRVGVSVGYLWSGEWESVLSGGWGDEAARNPRETKGSCGTRAWAVVSGCVPVQLCHLPVVTVESPAVLMERRLCAWPSLGDVEVKMLYLPSGSCHAKEKRRKVNLHE